MVRLKNGMVVYEYTRRSQAPVNLGELAHGCAYKVSRMTEKLEISSRQLERHFQKALGVSPKYWMRMQRMIRARQLIREGNTLKAISLDLGFSKYDKFAQELKSFYNVSPLEMVACERRNCYEPAAFDTRREPMAHGTPTW